MTLNEGQCQFALLTERAWDIPVKFHCHWFTDSAEELVLVKSLCTMDGKKKYLLK